MGVFNFIGTIGSGFLTDRLDPRNLLLVDYGFRGVSLLFFSFVIMMISCRSSSPVRARLHRHGATDGRPRRRPVRSTQRRRGCTAWVFASHMVGAAVAAWVAGIVRENVGDYAAAFIAAGLIATVAGFAALAIRRKGPDADIRSSLTPHYQEVLRPHRPRLIGFMILVWFDEADFPNAAARSGARGQVKAGAWAVRSSAGARGHVSGRCGRRCG